MTDHFGVVCSRADLMSRCAKCNSEGYEKLNAEQARLTGQVQEKVRNACVPWVRSWRVPSPAVLLATCRSWDSSMSSGSANAARNCTGEQPASPRCACKDADHPLLMLLLPRCGLVCLCPCAAPPTTPASSTITTTGASLRIREGPKFESTRDKFENLMVDVE